MSQWEEFILYFLGTFVSEDLTCISGGILAEQGKSNLTLVILSCTLGIFLSDLWLFVMGKFFFHISQSLPLFQKALNSEILIDLKTKSFNHYKKLIFISRFTPGTRLPIYFLSGSLNYNFSIFAIVSFIASVIWTPLLIMASYFYGKTILLFFSNSNSILIYIFVLISFFILYKFLFMILLKENRKSLVTLIQKISKLEFWPVWIFYLPLIPYIFYLMIRYRGIRVITCSNPGIPQGGLAGESKYEILKNLPLENTVKSILIQPDSDEIQFIIEDSKFEFPLIVKPDVGERGSFIKKISSIQELELIIKTVSFPVILQDYHPGPFELGVFYYRYPTEANGKIFSITEKKFPYVLGDGKSNLKELILNHSRYKFQSDTFLKNNEMDLDMIIPLGEFFPIGFLGNHIQGCLFQDGSKLLTNELEKKIDSISKKFEGFYFGRYDIRYTNESELKQGKNFKIIELNGASSESTNLYDPKFSIFQAYKILFRQWRILFSIGCINRKMGIQPSTWSELFQMLISHSKHKTILKKI
jgi:membrane protein DedA with SNARE-associated domain